MGYAITTDGLGRMFGSRWAVRDLNLKIETGEVFGLLGPNGAGKTTIMRMLSSLIAPTAGNASVCDFDVVAQADQVRRHIGISASRQACTTTCPPGATSNTLPSYMT